MRYETRQSNFSRDEIVRQEELGRALKEYQKHVASINAEMRQFLKLENIKEAKVIKLEPQKTLNIDKSTKSEPRKAPEK